MPRTAANIAGCFRSSRGRGLWRRPSFFALAVLALGLLLWARFLLVTGHPRTAIAEPPRAVEQAASQSH